MNCNLEKAKTILSENNYTCVLCSENKTYTSQKRGVNPLVDWIADGTDLTHFSAADCIVGKAAAFLYVLLGVDAVFAPVMSEDAISTLSDYGILPSYDESVEEIRNRMDTGCCPMEEAVANCKEPTQSLNCIKQKLISLRNEKPNMTE